MLSSIYIKCQYRIILNIVYSVGYSCENENYDIYGKRGQQDIEVEQWFIKNLQNFMEQRWVYAPPPRGVTYDVMHWSWYKRERTERLCHWSSNQWRRRFWFHPPTGKNLKDLFAAATLWCLLKNIFFCYLLLFCKILEDSLWWWKLNLLYLLHFLRNPKKESIS